MEIDAVGVIGVKRLPDSSLFSAARSACNSRMVLSFSGSNYDDANYEHEDLSARDKDRKSLYLVELCLFPRLRNLFRRTFLLVLHPLTVGLNMCESPIRTRRSVRILWLIIGRRMEKTGLALRVEIETVLSSNCIPLRAYRRCSIEPESRSSASRMLGLARLAIDAMPGPRFLSGTW